MSFYHINKSIQLLTRICFVITICFLICSAANAADVKTTVKQGTATKSGISYHKQIWPILQAKCQSCHQPATSGGKLIVTSYAEFLKGGEHGASFQAGKSASSSLLEYLTGKRTLMPKGGPSLPDANIALFRRWISEGAKDDTPILKDPIDATHPPLYESPPVLTALAYSPDSSTLAVAGYREILLHHADGSGIAARLVGQSQKILSLNYSADGKMLAAVGGNPAQFGEIQFWDTTNQQIINTVKSTYDTLFGGSLSSDGKFLGFGCADNSVRIITIPDGKQTMRLDNHSDWVFATAFSMDNKNILSIGRDQAIKLTLIEGASFIDDINTHYTALRCMARNPKADQVAVGGDDGLPRIYKVFRTEARSMNQEDHNLLRTFDKQSGAATAIAYSSDGALLAVGSESGIVNVYNSADGKSVAKLTGLQGVVYSVVFRPDGKQIATGGFDGKVRLYEMPSGKLVKAFVPVPMRVKQIARQ